MIGRKRYCDDCKPKFDQEVYEECLAEAQVLEDELAGLKNEIDYQYKLKKLEEVEIEE